MAGEIEPEHLLLVAEHLILRPLRDRHRRRPARALAGGGGDLGEPLEERHLAFLAVALPALAGFHGLIERGQERGPRDLDRIEGPGLDQALDHPPVDETQVRPRAEVREGHERAALLAGADDGLDGGAADILDGPQPEVDRVAADGELRAADVDVGRLHAQAHRAALLHVLDDLVGLVHFRGEQRRHELDGVVGLEVGRLVGHHGVARGVRVVDRDAIGDEALRAGHFEVVGRLLPLEREAPRPRPAHPRLRQRVELRGIESSRQVREGVATDATFRAIVEDQAVGDPEIAAAGLETRIALEDRIAKEARG